MLGEHRAILTFLELVRKHKGPSLVHLKVGGRSGVSTEDDGRGGSRSAGADFSYSNKASRPPAPAGSDALSTADATLFLKEGVAFTGLSPVAGYVHVFDLGTSGTCCLLAPSEDFPDNRVEANQPFHLPSDKFLSAEALDSDWFPVGGPVSAEYGSLDYLFVVVSQDESLNLDVKDLDPALKARQILPPRDTRGDGPQRSPGFGRPVEHGRSRLFALPKDSWHYGVLAMEIRPRPPQE
jgi:hypothetical protein